MAIPIKKNGKLTGRWREQVRIMKNGKTVFSECKTGSCRKKLEQWKAHLLGEIEKKGINEVKKTSTSIASAIRLYIDGFAPEDFQGNSKWGHLQMLLNRYPVLGDLETETVEASDLIQFAKERKVGPKTLEQDFSFVRVALKGAKTSNGVKINFDAFEEAVDFMRGEGMMGPGKKRDRRPSVEEMDTLLDYFSKVTTKVTEGIPMVDIILFTLFSGRRRSEIPLLRWDDIDEEHNTITIRKMKHPTKKEYNDKEILFMDEAFVIINKQPKTGEYIFPYDPVKISNIFCNACKMFGFEKLVFHSLRHDFTSCCFEKGWNTPTVQAYTGHMSWKNLEVYTHLKRRGDKYKGWKWRPVVKKEAA